jgi:hypothetical protein
MYYRSCEENALALKAARTAHRSFGLQNDVLLLLLHRVH